MPRPTDHTSCSLAFPSHGLALLAWFELLVVAILPRWLCVIIRSLA
jgi:hypothetical protein